MDHPDTIGCINDDCGGLMVKKNGVYDCASCHDTTTEKGVERRRKEAKQVVAA